ncbi:MAG: virulence factor family protein [Phycisphaerales bacterium]|nr:virulence factor family protein [Phycisphaerales bacterium]
MYDLSRVLLLGLAILLSSVVRAEIIEETLDYSRFGKLAVYHSDEEPKGTVLFVSGKDGWTADLAAAAREIADLSFTVVGIDLNTYLAQLDRVGVECVDSSVDLDQLNHFLEQRYSLDQHRPAILLGEGAGAALVYSALAQAPAERFHAGIATDFCPELPLSKPLCPGAGNLESALTSDHKQVLLKPVTRLLTTWFVFQNRSACGTESAEQFIKSVQLARLTELTGAEGFKTVLPQLLALLQWLDPSISHQVQPSDHVSGVPLTEVLASTQPEQPRFAVMFSGDGGWAMLDRAVAEELAKQGLAVVGWDSLSYFWKPHQPEEVALDLERVLRSYMQKWNKERVVLIGYSFGADILPAIINRLPQDLRDRIDLAAFLGLSGYAIFEFHLSNWVSDEPGPGSQPIQPELAKLMGFKRLCIYGADEDAGEDPCPQLADLGLIVEKMPGDHHFDEDYPEVAQRILRQLPPSPTATPSPPPRN